MSDPPGAVAGVGIDPSNPHRLFAFADSFGVALSQDGGKSWQARNTGLRLAQHEFIFAFAFDPKDADHVFAATPERVFRTNDGGANWETIL